MTRKPPFLPDRSLRTGSLHTGNTAPGQSATIGRMAEAPPHRRTSPAAFLKLEDFDPAAREVLPQAIYDYIAGGSEDEATLRGNREAFARYRFRFKILASADRPDLTHEVFGQRFTMPVHLAPTAIQRMAHPGGEAAAYQAASDAGIAFGLSTLSSLSIEEVAAAATGARWFQLYMHPERAVSTAFVERAVDAGYSAILLTVDLTRTGRREGTSATASACPRVCCTPISRAGGAGRPRTAPTRSPGTSTPTPTPPSAGRISNGWWQRPRCR